MSMDRSFGRDRRGVTVTDTMAVGALLAFTVLIGAGLGASVIFTQSGEEESTGPIGNFSYNHVDPNSALLVTYKKGDTFKAGNITLNSGSTNVTWATVANETANTTIDPNDAVQLSDSSKFGTSITTADTVNVYYTGGNETIRLSQWVGGEGY